MQKAKELDEIARADDLLEQMRSLQTKTLDTLAAAEKAGDRKTMLGAIREARGNIELLGKLTGRFDEKKPQRGHLHASDHRLHVDSRPPGWRSAPEAFKRFFVEKGEWPTPEEQKQLLAQQKTKEGSAELPGGHPHPFKVH